MKPLRFLKCLIRFETRLAFGLFMVLLSGNSLTAYGLTDRSKVSILTYEPGKELYTIFGHTALRIQDSTLGIDYVYNFGTFDFSSPFFYIKFFGGRLDYFLAVSDYSIFLQYAYLEHRVIHEQTLGT